MSEVSDLARKLKTEGEKFAGIFASLTDQQWQTEVYTEGETWTVRNILSHLMTTERGFVRIFANICDGGKGVPEDFSIDRYNAEQQEKTRGIAPADLLEQYKAARAQMVDFVSQLDESDLERVARHPFLQVTTLREMIKMVYLHNQIHYRDIRKALG